MLFAEPFEDVASVPSEDTTHSIDILGPLQAPHNEGNAAGPDSKVQDYDPVVASDPVQRPTSGFLLSSASVYPTESLGSPINFSARSPIDEAIMETLEELDRDILNCTLHLENLEQPLDTIYEEDDTSVQGSTTAQSIASLRSNRPSLHVLPSSSGPGISTTRTLLALQEVPLCTPTAPQTPTNTPVDGAGNICATHSLPSISSRLFAACAPPEHRDKLKGRITKSYIRMLPPLVRLASFDVEGPASNLHIFMYDSTECYVYQRSWNEEPQEMDID